MKEKIRLYYDEESDYLEMNIGDYKNCVFRELDKNTAEIVDEKTGKVTGISIMGFKTRFSKSKDKSITISLKN